MLFSPLARAGNFLSCSAADAKRLAVVAAKWLFIINFLNTVGFIGLALLWYGLRDIYAPLAPVVVGALLVIYAVAIALLTPPSRP